MPAFFVCASNRIVIQCITGGCALRVEGFLWDDVNVVHLEMGHGIEPEEAEEVFAINVLFRKTKKGHYFAYGPTLDGRYLTLVFEFKKDCLGRIITGWDMTETEKRYWRRHMHQ